MAVRELKNYTNNKKQKAFIITIDQEKAFGKVGRNLPYETMEKQGYSKQFIQIINILYQDTQALIINNGYSSTPFKIERGVRQGCPLSLLLYTIYGELINVNIANNKNIQGVKTPNKTELKLLQFADDTNLITINEESIIETLDFFKKYEKASGATISINKTKITPLANAQIYNYQNKIQKFRITKNKEIFKILGIHFSKDLQYVNEYDWREFFPKIEKRRINLLSTILSKTQFLRNIFPIPKNRKTTSQINLQIYLIL